MSSMIDKETPKHWLVFANANRCDHYKALKELGFVSWKKERNNFKIGDVVYVFSSLERRIIYKTKVVKEEMRADMLYWKEPAPMHQTWRLEAVEEYVDNKLHETQLKEHGFKGGRSLQHPMCNNKELFDYIESQFGDN